MLSQLAGNTIYALLAGTILYLLLPVPSVGRLPWWAFVAIAFCAAYLYDWAKALIVGEENEVDKR